MYFIPDLSRLRHECCIFRKSSMQMTQKYILHDALLVKHSALNVVCPVYILMMACVGTNIKT